MSHATRRALPQPVWLIGFVAACVPVDHHDVRVTVARSAHTARCGVQTQQLEVRDLWEHKVVGTTTPAAGYTASNLAAEGGSTMVRVYRPPPASA